MMFVLPILLAGCATHRSSSTAHVGKDNEGRYEIRLDAKEWVAGGPCNIAWPHRIPISHWIYVSTMEGEVPATRLALTYYRGKTERPWSQQELHGSVTFSRNHMRVAFETPIFLDGKPGVDHYEPYELNGNYRLEIE